jgi:uncharacterized Ntn-hydrolase superfamily protein
MALIKETFNIGETCVNGVISIEINKATKTVDVINRLWDIQKGWTKKSDQSNSKEMSRKTISFENSKNFQTELFMTLTDLTTTYHAENIENWIKGKIDFVSTAIIQMRLDRAKTVFL